MTLGAVCLHVCFYFYLLSLVTGGPCSSPKPGGPRCDLHSDDNLKPSKLFCNGGITKRSKTFFISEAAMPRSLVLCQISKPEFDPSFLVNYPNITRLGIINSNVSKFVKNFPQHHLQVLNMTRLKLTRIHVELLLDLKDLKVLDLSYNNIKRFDNVTRQVLARIQQIYLKGDSWDCSSDLKWILNTKNSSFAKKIKDKDQMFCDENLFSGKPVAGVMNFFKSVDSECPNLEGHKCRCFVDNIVWSQSKPPYLVPLITVDCSHLALKQMPSRLPTNTTSLLLNNNEITDLTPLINNHNYKMVTDIYLDDNLISSIDKLVMSDWLADFRVLSLRGNRIKKISSSAFNGAFRRNYNIYKIYLGNNPWICDCVFTPGFKELILKFKSIIKDEYEIRCGNKNKLVKDLNLGEICKTSSDPVLSGLDILNITLASLILLILGKFLYDYWVYKSSGKLPWIVMKMP